MSEMCVLVPIIKYETTWRLNLLQAYNGIFGTKTASILANI